MAKTSKPQLKWTKIENNLWVAKWSSKANGDIRSYQLRGYWLTADLLDVHPVTGKQLSRSEWFMFKSKKNYE